MNENIPPETHLKLRILFGDRAMFGPGKADLLENIATTGSIAAAGRAMGMSYKRAWMLVEEMNAAFDPPLVGSMRGGAGGGGASLTAAGAQAVAHYRAIERVASDAVAAEMGALSAMLRDMSEGK